MLENRKKGMKDPFLAIAADKLASHGTVIDVLDIAMQTGIHQVIYLTEPKE